MSYSAEEKKVESLTLVPKHFFTPDIIERRKPLSSSAKRAGWVGCNILVSEIPKQGMVTIISDGQIHDRDEVVRKTNRAYKLETNGIDERTWLFDVLSCVNKIPSSEFTLGDVYAFENELSARHPNNRNIRPKIRQQLQLLRDREVIEFTSAGHYKKL